MRKSWLSAGVLAARAAFRFMREHGARRAVRLAVLGAWTLGPRGLVRRAAAETRLREDDARYRAWLPSHTRDTAALDALRVEVTSLTRQPRISLITPVYNTPPEWLRRCVASVQRQVYTNWELCLCDDGSTDAATLAVLQEVTQDPRVRVVRSALNGGIVRASNAALAIATGEYVGLLDHDDELTDDALAEVVLALDADPAIDIVYTDEDKVDSSGTQSQPHFKPDWSPEQLRSCMYVSHFLVLRRAIVDAAGGFREGTDGAQDYDLMLRLMERTPHVHHIPKVLYHWRMLSGSTASSQLGKPWAVAAGQRALEAHLDRLSIPARVTSGEANGHFIVRYAIHHNPLVSVVVPPHAAGGVRTAFGRARYGHHEVISRPGAAHENVRVTGARGEYLVFLEGVDRRLSDGWLELLLGLAQQDGIGVVSGLVCFPDGTIENAGYALRTDGTPMPMFRDEPSWTRGHLSNILDVRNVSAVGGVCMMTRRATFEAVGGFDESAGSLYAVDYCLRVRRAGLRVAVTPDVSARRSSTNAAKPTAAEIARLRDTWGDFLARDPYYNPNFDQTRATFRLYHSDESRTR